MHVVTPFQMRRIDQRAIEEFGIPGIVLMENAALKTVELIFKYYPHYNWNYPYGSTSLNKNYKEDSGENTLVQAEKISNVLVVAGCGNNGGDGLAIARHLFLAGYNAAVFIVSEGGRKPKGDAGINLNALLSLQESYADSDALQIRWIEKRKDLFALQAALNKTHLIIDALFGTGLDRPVDGLYAAVIDLINEKQNGSRKAVPVVAVDIPSGINGESGKVMGTALRADHTAAYGYAKPGHLLFPGRDYAGRLHVVPISLPGDSAEYVQADMFTLSDEEAAGMLKIRPRNSHKGTFGRVAVIAGSTGMTGAAHLTAQAAMRSGAGLVTLGIPSSLNPIMEQKLTEVMTWPLEDKGSGHLVPESYQDAEKLLKDKEALAFGPGCGKNSGVLEILRNILGSFNIPIVIDADGLNHISRDMNMIRSYRAPVVLTPHPGEMARLTGLKVEDIVSRPVEIAAQMAKEYGCIMLLKGAASVVAEPGGRVYINASGTSGMAKGGSGDILTGMIASLIAQGYDAFDAAVLGCFIHGRAGEQAARYLGETGMTAEDILNAIPHAFKGLYELTK